MNISFSNLHKAYRNSLLKWWEAVLLVAFFAIFPLGQLERLGWIQGGNIYFHDIICVIWLVGHITFRRSEYTKAKLSAVWKAWKLEILCGVWIAVGILLALVTSHNLLPLLYVIRIVTYGLFAWSVGKKLRYTPMTLRIALGIVGGWYWWLAMLQYIFLPDTRFLWLYGWDDHYYRMIGTLFDPGFTGMLFVLVILVTWSIKNILPKWIFITAICAFIGGVILTYSRASYLAGLATFLLLFSVSQNTRVLTKQNLIQVLLVGTLSLGVWLLAPKPGGDGVQLLRTTSIEARITSATSSLTQLSAHELIIGRGLFSPLVEETINSNSTASSYARMPDNIFITLLTQTGVIGLVLVGFILTRALISLFREQPLFFIAFIAVIVHSQFNNTLLQPFIFLYLMLFLASEISGEKQVS